LIVLVGRIVAPPHREPTVVAETAGSAAVFGGRAALGVIGSILVTRAPMLVATIASALGYAVGDSTPTDAEGGGNTLLSILYSLRPVLAAIIAIAVGELVASMIRRRRGAPGVEHRST
jgi:hypothetical protein